MGTWGTALYSDDNARDVRDQFRDHIGDGLDAAAALERLMQEWGTLAEDPDTGPPFWLALADTQWKLGRLEPAVLQRALEIIDEDRDVRRWEGRDRERRTAVLAKLRAQLLQPQPPPKRVPKRYRDTCDWPAGQVFAYALRSGHYAIFRVIGHHQDRGGRGPVCELLSWQGDVGSLPAPEEISHLPVVTSQRCRQMLIGRTSARELPEDRVQLLQVGSTPSQKPSGFTVGGWRYLDRLLNELFGLR